METDFISMTEGSIVQESFRMTLNFMMLDRVLSMPVDAMLPIKGAQRDEPLFFVKMGGLSEEDPCEKSGNDRLEKPR